jgi:hypothetical protein
MERVSEAAPSIITFLIYLSIDRVKKRRKCRLIFYQQRNTSKKISFAPPQAVARNIALESL